MKQVKTTRYLREKKRATFRYLKRAWSTEKQMVFHDYGVRQENTNIISFKRAAIYHPRALPSSIPLTNDNKIRTLHSKHLSFIVIIRSFEGKTLVRALKANNVNLGKCNIPKRYINRFLKQFSILIIMVLIEKLKYVRKLIQPSRKHFFTERL